MSIVSKKSVVLVLAVSQLLQDIGPAVVTSCTCSGKSAIAKCTLSTSGHGQQGRPSFTEGPKYRDLGRELKKRICGEQGRSERK